MSRQADRIKMWADKVTALRLQLLIIAVVGGLIVLVALRFCTRGDHAELAHTATIDPTPVQIAKIQSIGQWEFLAISDEELVDTVRHGFFGDDELARIYYGTLRLGIDLQQAGDDLLTVDGDTIVALLPPIRLLDQNFIDEARTKTFYEDGHWTEADRQAMTGRAHALMLRRCLTPANIQSAEQNASAQMNQLLRSMGYKYIKVRFKPGHHKKQG